MRSATWVISRITYMLEITQVRDSPNDRLGSARNNARERRHRDQEALLSFSAERRRRLLAGRAPTPSTRAATKNHARTRVSKLAAGDMSARVRVPARVRFKGVPIRVERLPVRVEESPVRVDCTSRAMQAACDTIR